MAGYIERDVFWCCETMAPSTGSALRKMERLGLIYESEDKADDRKRYIYLDGEGEEQSGNITLPCSRIAGFCESNPDAGVRGDAS